MRLSAEEAKAIREEVKRADPAATAILFGSRVDDGRRGGDIDLLVVSERLGFRGSLCLKAAILDRIGWQQFDLLVRPAARLNEPLASLAVATGVKL